MRITVRWFARLREQAGVEAETLAFEDPVPTLERLREHLAAARPALAEQLRTGPVLCAVNREYAAAGTLLRDGDEVAFLPPVTGG